MSNFTNIQLAYYDISRRLQKGVAIFDDRTYFTTVDQTTGRDVRVRQAYRNTGGLFSFVYPLSRYHRVSLETGFISRSIDYPYAQTNADGSQGVVVFPRDDNFPIIGGSFVGDTTLYQEWGPYSGRRYRLSTSWAPDLKKGQINPVTLQPEDSPTLTYDATIDFRQYIPITARSLFAFALFGGYSTGNFPTVYYFGGLDTLRGLDYQAVIGNSVAFGNFELRIPLIDYLVFPIGGLRNIRGAHLLRHRRREAEGAGLPVLGHRPRTSWAEMGTHYLRRRLSGVAPRPRLPLGLRAADQPEAHAVGRPEFLLHRPVVLAGQAFSRSPAGRPADAAGEESGFKFLVPRLESEPRVPRNNTRRPGSRPLGGSAPGYRLTTFLLDGETAIDAGCLTDALPLSAQRRVRRVVLTHAHFDHIASLPLLCDNLYGQRRPLGVHPASVLSTLSRDIFNDRVWPDFSTRLPSRARPTVRLRPVAEGRPFRAGSATITPFAVRHTVPAYGYVVSKRGRSVLFTGDTRPTDRLGGSEARPQSQGDLPGGLLFQHAGAGGLRLRALHAAPDRR